MKFLLRGWTLIGLGMFAATTLAEPADDFRSGVEAFRAGNFDQARQYFVQAQESGLQSPALLFNLGSTYYRLGRYDEAAAAFAAVGQDPAWGMLSRYNLGLVAWEQGDRLRAAGYFSEVSKHATDSKLASAALLMWERIDPMARFSPRSRVTASLGYDSNVIQSDQLPSGSASGKSDFYTEIQATTGAWIGRSANAPKWEAGIYDVRYSDLNDYNLTQASVGLDQPWALGNWVLLGGVQARQLWLDGASFQRLGSIRGATIYSIDRDQLVRGDLRYSQVISLSNRYDYLEGHDIEIDVSYTRTYDRSWLVYGLTYAQNSRKDFASATEFYSYSPDRIGAWIRGAWSMGARWTLSPSARFRTSQYAGTDRHGGVAQGREDNDWQIGLLLRYRWTPHWAVAAEYTHARNNSNYSEFSYSRDLIQIGASRAF